MKDLLKLTAHELIEKYSSRELSPSEFFSLQFRFALFIEPMLGSFLSLAGVPDEQQAIAEQHDGKLSGIPISVKDILATRDFVTTAGSRILEGYQPHYDATAVKLMLDSSNPIIGKTNLDEFAMGSSTEFSGYHVTRNPWNTQRVPGGSSGGSAAAVAALQSVISLGTDTGGSVRQPAAFCGVVGFLPSYGMVSRYGLFAFASSLDQVGILARDVKDVAITMNTISHPDVKDATCIAKGNQEFIADLEDKEIPAGCRIGIVTQLSDPKLISSDVLTRVDLAVSTLSKMGCSVIPISVPLIDLLLPCYYILSPAEASSNLARYDGIKYGLGFPACMEGSLAEHYFSVRQAGFGEEVKRRILSGTYVLSAGYADEYYNRARMVRRQVADAVNELFKDVDFLVTPTTPAVAFKLGEKLKDPVSMYAADTCTVLANLCSIPAISLPVGLGQDNLPVGFQIIAPRLQDAKLLSLAHQFEQVHGEGYLVPPLVEDALARFEG